MTRMVYVGVAATMLLACAPTVAQETAETPDASVANEAAEPTATMAAEETAMDETQATSVAAMGEPISCKRGETVRHVNVVSPGSEGRVCELHYAKPTEGMESRMLWYATADKNFCDEKANSLMAKLTAAGWSCTNPDGTPVTVEASVETETAPETVTAPESAAQPMEADHPAEPEEPADAPEAPEAPEEPSEGDEPN